MKHLLVAFLITITVVLQAPAAAADMNSSKTILVWEEENLKDPIGSFWADPDGKSNDVVYAKYPLWVRSVKDNPQVWVVENQKSEHIVIVVRTADSINFYSQPGYLISFK